MNINSKKILFIIPFLLLSCIQLLGQTKLAQTGYQFLSVQTDARATAMGDAFTTISGSSSSLFYNPAGMADITGFVDMTLASMKWIADINYNSLSLALSPAQGQYGVFGVSFVTVDYGDDIYGTMVWGNNDGFIETGTLDARAIAVGLGYARDLSDKFSVGGQVRWVSQHLGESVIPGKGVRKNLTDVLSFDFGTIYKTGFKSLVFGMSVRNFSEEITFEEEGLQLPLTFKIGVSANASDLFLDIPEQHSLLISLDAVHPRSFDEYLNFGLEYGFKDIAALRMGYVSAQDERSMVYGAGIKWLGFGIDYSYTPFGVFDAVQRFSVTFEY